MNLKGNPSRWFSVGICKYEPGYKSHTKKNKSENLGGISWVLGFFLTNVVVIN